MKHHTLKTFIKEAQASEIAKKHEQLEEEEKVSGRSKIVSMKPHLDEDGITRCISRLEATRNVPEQVTESVLLPKDHEQTKMIVLEENEKFPLTHLSVNFSGAKTTQDNRNLQVDTEVLVPST